MQERVRELVDKATVLPGEVAELVARLAAKRQELHMLLDAQRRIEVHVAGQVAAENGDDGRKKYPNEESRRAEIFKRLAFHEDYQKAEHYLTRVRGELMELESRLELARYEFRSATCLLTLLASAVQANRPDIEQAVLGGTQGAPQVAATNGREQHLANFAAAVNQVVNGQVAETPKANGNGRTNRTETGEIEILEVRPASKPNTLRFWCRTAEGETAVYAKDGMADLLARNVGKKVVITYKRMDAGWLAMKLVK
jgi:hypothetical protein